jgi:hypothetical protein
MPIFGYFNTFVARILKNNGLKAEFCVKIVCLMLELTKSCRIKDRIIWPITFLVKLLTQCQFSDYSSTLSATIGSNRMSFDIDEHFSFKVSLKRG